jgi:hypothetical protein
MSPAVQHTTTLVTASGTVKPFNGVLRGIKLVAGTTAATVSARNSATGATIGHANCLVSTAAPEQVYDAPFDTSLYISIAGTGAVAFIEYQ